MESAQLACAQLNFPPLILRGRSVVVDIVLGRLRPQRLHRVLLLGPLNNQMTPVEMCAVVADQERVSTYSKA